MAALVTPDTATGTVLLPVVAPLPSFPLLALPQQRTPPSLRRAQVCLLPSETSTAVLMPETCWGR